MNQLLDYWIESNTSGVPTANLPSYKTRLSFFGDNWKNVKIVEQMINRISLIVSFSLRLGNLKIASGA